MHKHMWNPLFVSPGLRTFTSVDGAVRMHAVVKTREESE